MNLEAFVKRTVELVDMVFDTTRQVVPMYHIVTRKGEHLVFPFIGIDKDQSAAIARAYFEMVDATRYVFFDEAWVLDSRDPNLDIEKINREGGVRNHPDRKEVVMFSAEDENEGQILAHQEIIRDPGKPPRLGPLEMHSGNTNEGRMVGMLPPHKGKAS